MATKKRASPPELSRLTVLAAGDESAFAAYAIELLASDGRLAREAAIQALVERPLPAARDALRALYFELDADGAKRDQGAAMRVGIVQALRSIGDVRDAEIGVRAIGAHEVLFGEDAAWALRVHGLRMLAELAPDLFAYYAIEHLDDSTALQPEPANTAFALLAGTGNYPAIYQWLLSADREPEVVANAFEVLAEGAPRTIVERYVERVIDVALHKQDEAMLTVLAEAIVRLELSAAYPAIERILSGKLSDELYHYIALLLAGTNRPLLLVLLESQLRGGRRPRIIAEALRVRPTPEGEAIVRRWEADPDVEG